MITLIELVVLSFMQSQNGHLIRIEINNVHLPEICPVCGSPATTLGVVASTVGLRRRSGPQYYFGRDFGMVGRSVRRLQVPVCELHHSSVDESSRVRSVLMLVFGFTIPLLMFQAFIGALLYVDYGFLGLDWFLTCGLTVLVGLASFKTLGPSGLEKAISIMNIDIGPNVLAIRVKETWYRDELLRTNPGAAASMRLTRRSRSSL